ncbi:MAG: hypothetical protein GEU98_24475 [Pseudonocardiaceae bacterium]|nr:hypothetical protein [Pseudonocardiaceae bacterium]
MRSSSHCSAGEGGQDGCADDRGEKSSRCFGGPVVVGTGKEWTVILPCLIVTGVGSGIVMPQLIGLAVGVVPADRAGMASGLSSTFFPLGSSTGVAVYGAIMAAIVGARIHNPDAARSIVAGRIDQLDAGTSTATAELAAEAGEAFTAGLSTILLVAGILAFASAVAALLLIRTKDVLAATSRD